MVHRSIPRFGCPATKVLMIVDESGFIGATAL
jgi:hypothetical protein